MLPPLPRRPRALLLDFDGVVLDSATLKTRAFGELYAGTDPDRLEAIVDYVERHGGVTRADKIAHIERSFFGRSGDAERVGRLAARFRARVFDAVVGAEFVPGAEALLERAQGAIALHLVSGTPHEELREIVAARGLEGRFASVDGAPPDKATSFARLLRERGYAPGETLAVGDALTEFEAARELGVPFLAIVPPGARNRFPPDVPAVPDLRPAIAYLRLG
jgi:phosphoglycolate phosphatase-like HAD superfamily hydrolase